MDVDDLLRTLRDPRVYADAPASVECVQTHISVVALAGDEVFKFKKPVRLPFLDFSSLAQRERFCREEVRLNRRLCPDVYLGLAALVRTGDGLRVRPEDHALDRSAVVDWAVRMRRLPADRMLDRLLERDAVDADDVAALARRLAAFHATAERGGDVARHGDPDRLAGFAHENFRELEPIARRSGEPPDDRSLPRDLLLALAARSRRDFTGLLPVLRRRAAADRVVDGHGDLHARNICMTEPPAIYDCIEFEPAFRCGDVATEIAFLVMDLGYRRAPALARAFARAYAAAAGDDELERLLPPLVQYRAVVRAKVGALAAAEPELTDDDRRAAMQSAARHLEFAAGVAVDAGRPTWLVLCGPPASGKSALADRLADVMCWPVVSTDRVRKELAGVAPTERLPADAYSGARSDATYAEVARRATAATRGGAATVLLDGNFATPARRRAAADAARAAGARAFVVHVDVDDATARRRLAARERDASSVSDAGLAQFAALRDRFVAPGPDEGSRGIRVDGRLGRERLAAALLAALVDLGTTAPEDSAPGQIEPDDTRANDPS